MSECSCAINNMADGTQLTMLRDPNCPEHGDAARQAEVEAEVEQQDPERWDGMS